MSPAVRRHEAARPPSSARGVVWVARIVIVVALPVVAVTPPLGEWIVPVLLLAVAATMWRYRVVLGRVEAMAIAVIATVEAVMIVATTTLLLGR